MSPAHFPAHLEFGTHPLTRLSPSDLPSRGYWDATPGRNVWGSHHIQHSCVLKHLPSRLTTKTLITLAAGSKHSNSET